MQSNFLRPQAEDKDRTFAARKQGQIDTCALVLRGQVREPYRSTIIRCALSQVDRRENWEQYLEFLKVPEANWEIAKKAPDFHEYYVPQLSFLRTLSRFFKGVLGSFRVVWFLKECFSAPGARSSKFQASL